MIKEIPKFCRDCGFPLEYTIQRADKIKIDYYCFGGIIRSRLASAYNNKTGEENLADIYTCPNWGRTWLWGGNSHDKIISYNNDLHYE